MARVCGRLGLCRARPAPSPSRRASRESQLARRISRHRIVSRNGAIRVTFAGEAIRGVPFQRRLTVAHETLTCKLRTLDSFRQVITQRTLGIGFRLRDKVASNSDE